MRIEQALKLRDKCMMRLKDIYSSARCFNFTSQELNKKVNDIYECLPKKSPAWIRSYCDGARQILTDELYHAHLIFLFMAPDGSLIDTSQMPEGWSHQRICEERLASGHFWIKTRRPFFIGQD